MIVPYLGYFQRATGIPIDQIRTHALLCLCSTTSGAPDPDATIQIADAVNATGIRPKDSQEKTPGAGDDAEEDDFVTVGDAEQPAGDQVVLTVTIPDTRQDNRHRNSRRTSDDGGK